MQYRFYYPVLIIAVTTIIIFFSCEPRNIVDVDATPVPYGQRVFSPDWEQADELDGYEVTALEQSFNSYIIAATSGGNLFRSKSDGDYWILAPAANTPVTLVYRANISYIFAAADEGKLYFSNTNGRTWELLKSFSQGINSIVSAKDNSLILGTTAGLYISTDSAGVWNNIKEGIPSDLLIYSLITLRDGKILAGTISGVYQSADNGISWDKTLFEERCYVFTQSYQSALFAGTQKGIYRSDDNGETWFNSGLSEERITSLKVIKETHVFAGTSKSGVFYSHNNGYNWTYFGFENYRINSILDVIRLDMIMVTAGDKVYRITAEN